MDLRKHWMNSLRTKIRIRKDGIISKRLLRELNGRSQPAAGRHDLAYGSAADQIEYRNLDELETYDWNNYRSDLRDAVEESFNKWTRRDRTEVL